MHPISNKPARFFASAKTHVSRKKKHSKHAITLLKDHHSYHQNPKIMMVVNPSKFLDTDLIREKGSILMQIFDKRNKFPLH